MWGRFWLDFCWSLTGLGTLVHILWYMRLKCARFGFVWYLLFFKVLLIYKFVTFKGFNYNKNISNLLKWPKKKKRVTIHFHSAQAIKVAWVANILKCINRRTYGFRGFKWLDEHLGGNIVMGLKLIIWGFSLFFEDLFSVWYWRSWFE